MHNVSSQLSVTIIILNWNGKQDTLDCISSVTKSDYQNYRIVLVDNGSTDGSVLAIKDYYPDLTLLETGENLGYAGGNNVGIRWALEHDSDYIFILNNDTVVATDLLTHLVNAEKNLPKGSILGAKIYYYAKSDTIWFAGGRWLHNENRFEHIGYGQQDGDDFNSVVEVDYITGCALFAESETFRRVGLLGEEFFLTYEETDWCFRAKSLGIPCFVIPEAKLWHKVSASFGGEESPLTHYFMSRNKMLWAKKHLPFLQRLRLHKENIFFLRNIFLPPFDFSGAEGSRMKNFYWSCVSWYERNKKNRTVIKATLFGLRDYYLGRFGNCPENVRQLKKTACN